VQNQLKRHKLKIASGRGRPLAEGGGGVPFTYRPFRRFSFSGDSGETTHFSAFRMPLPEPFVTTWDADYK